MRIFMFLLVVISCLFMGMFYYTHYIGQQVPLGKVRIAVAATPLSTPFYVAEQQGFFDASCVDVELVDIKGGGASFQLLMDNKVDFATSSDSVIVFQAAKLAKFSVLATFAESDNDIKILARNEPHAGNEINLKNKRVAYVENTSSEYLLTTYLALVGLNIEEVKNQTAKIAHLAQLLIENKVDAIVGWEPFIYSTLISHPSEVQVLETKNLYTIMFNLISQPLHSELQILQAGCVLTALNQATNFIAANPQKAKQVVINRLHVDTEFINWVWPDYIFKLSLNNSLVMNLNTQTTWLQARGRINTNSPPDFNQHLDARVLKKVNKFSVRLDGLY